ncbi:MAG TPA: hypothetical protein VK400_07795 [Pyrinomonadaceae bacterium]|nr:hypothetical protein [Pyrinomonadaceae bacterium]
MSAAASAQQVKITIRCLPEESGQETKKENPKDKKPEAGNRREKPARFELNGKNEKSADRESLVEEANIIPIGCVAQAIITVYTGPPGATVDYTVTQSNPSNIVELKRFLQNPYGNTVVIPVSLDASGYGVSSPFYVRGKILGETTLIGTSSFNNTTPLNILVVECKCPVIPANTPPRN